MEKELSKLDDSVEFLTKEKESLNFSLGETYSEEYIEKVAREDLGMQKPGEKVVVIKKEAAAGESQSNNFNLLQKLSEWFNSIKDRFIKPE